MSADCAFVGRHLGAFVDGELRGARMLRVLKHVDECADCAGRVKDLRDLGDLLRTAAPRGPEPQMLAGLESTILSRTRAEADQSWKGVWMRATDDWHWLMVGAGSVAATFASTVLLSALLAFGPKPVRGDSLSMLYATQDVPPPPIYQRNILVVTRLGATHGTMPMLMQLDDGTPDASSVDFALASRTSDRVPTEADLINAPEFKVQQIRLVTSTSVTAKGL